MILLKKKMNAPDCKYISAEIQNEMIEILTSIIADKMSSDIHEAGCYSIKDITYKEHSSIVLRYVLNGQIYERSTF
jgi:hypothetical protein